MCAHGDSLETLQTLKWVHNEPLTEKERLSYYDDDEASIVPRVLAADPFFQQAVETLVTLPPDMRTVQAEQIAKKYAAYKGPHQRLIAKQLLLAAKTPSRVRTTRLENSARRAVWAESPLEEHDGRRIRQRWQTLEDGAKRLARFGAGICIHLECTTPLASDQLGGRGRSWHCSAHQGELSAGVRDSQRNEIREALDAATGQRRARRAARRAV
jgi:hypothetical protein